MQQFPGDSPLCPVLLSFLGTGTFLAEAVHGDRADVSLLTQAVVCRRKTAAKGSQATWMREYCGIVRDQNIFVLGNHLLVLALVAFLKR